MPIPHRRYVLFLMTRGESERSIIELCTSLDLPPPTAEEFHDIEDHMEEVLPPAIVRSIEKKGPKPRDFMKWMLALDVAEMWETEKEYRAKGPTDTFKKIKLTLEEPRLRYAIEALLLTKTPAVDIARMVSARFFTALTEIHIEVLAKYFFSVDELKPKDWKHFIPRTDGRRRQILLTALTEDLEHLKVELDLPADISVASTLQYMLSKSTLRAKTFLAEAGPEAAKEARHWIDTTMKIVDKYEKYRSRDASDLSKQLQLEFDYTEEDYDEADATLLAEVQARKDIDPDKDK